MRVQGCEGVRSMHDLRTQGGIRHLTGNGNVFQQLQRLSRDRERVQNEYDMWMAKAVRLEERLVDIDRQTEATLRFLEPALEAAEREAGVG